MTYQASPKWFITNCLSAILHGVSWGLLTVSMQWFIDGVLKVTTGDASYTYAFQMLLLLLFVSIFQKVISSVSNFMVGNYFTYTNGHLNKVLFAKLDKIDPLCFENPSTLNDINKANEGKVRSNLLLNIPMMLVTFYLPYYLFMSIYLYSLRPIFIIIIPLVFVPVILSQLIRTKLYAKLEDELAPFRRESDHYRGALCDPTYLKETRLLCIFDYFFKLFTETIKLINLKTWKANFKASSYELLTRFITLMGYMGILGLLIVSLLNKNISVGAFAAVFSSISTLFSLFEDVACGMAGRLTQNIGSVHNFVRFLDLPERGGDIVTVSPDEIQFQNVSFRYPMQDEYAVKNVSFTIAPKSTVAIVGQNGSGKTTLIKLLTGLYLPTSGTVKLGKCDSKNISMQALFETTSGVFQNYHKYKMTLADNVSISQIDYKCDIDKIDESLKISELIIDDRFTAGYNTMLSREFDGIDLSDGQWQRIAIARGYFKDHALIVLDEPTASIDPIEESQIYKKFQEISRQKTSIVTTHRLGVTRISDVIFVMKDGELIEKGSHDQLMDLGGHYAMMYKAQSEWYN
jgi:ATP-binding cassette subfamily B protein